MNDFPRDKATPCLGARISFYSEPGTARNALATRHYSDRDSGFGALADIDADRPTAPPAPKQGGGASNHEKRQTRRQRKCSRTSVDQGKGKGEAARNTDRRAPAEIHECRPPADPPPSDRRAVCTPKPADVATARLGILAAANNVVLVTRRA